MKQVNISYNDAGRWMPLAQCVWKSGRLMDAEGIHADIVAWVSRGCSTRSNWGRFSLNGIRYEYDYDNGSESRMRLLLKLPIKGNLDPNQIRRAYNQAMNRLDMRLAERLGDEFVELCENIRSDVQETANDLAAMHGFTLTEPVRVVAPRENGDLDAIFST